MPCQLILMRHGHAEDAARSDSGSDHARSLTKRGRDEARATARWLKDIGVTPDVILASSAARVQETLEEVHGVFPGVVAHTHMSLYMASPTAYLKLLSECKPKVVMMIGHNPGISALASDLSGRDLYFKTALAVRITYPNGDWSIHGAGVSDPDDVEMSR
jgi:phosphohistidine phosphatase